MAERRSDLVGPYYFRGPAQDERRRHVNIEAVRRFNGAGHPITRAHEALREYVRRVPTFVGCATDSFLDAPAVHVGLCIRPPRHDGPHRFLMFSETDSAAIKRAARSTAPEEDAP